MIVDWLTSGIGLLTISTITFIGYISVIIYRYGIPSSISESYYKTHNPLAFFMFTFFLGVPILLFSPYPLLQVGGFFLPIVGLSPDFKTNDQKIEDEIHKIAAIMAISLALLAVIFNYGFWWILIPALLFGIFYKKIKNVVFWGECLAFILVLSALWLSYFGIG